MNNSQVSLFRKIERKTKNFSGKIYPVRDGLFFDALKQFPPRLKRSSKLSKLYDVSCHLPTKSLVIANKGAAIIGKTTRYGKLFPLFHLGLLVVNPNHGAEMVDVGIVGNIKNSKEIVVRAESACSPSFLMASQRCNCFDQWQMTQELAADFNSLKRRISQSNNPEREIRKEFVFRSHLPSHKDGKQAFILIHLSSQNGMGSGANHNIFTPDLAEGAHMRHRGEYSAEQILKTSMAGGFTSLGLTPDPRQLNHSFGYKVTGTVLDYLRIDKPIKLLTNNNLKIKALKELGFDVNHLPMIGRADKFDHDENVDRKNEFLHNIANTYSVSFDSEFKRIKNEIRKITSK